MSKSIMDIVAEELGRERRPMFQLGRGRQAPRIVLNQFNIYVQAGGRIVLAKTILVDENGVEVGMRRKY